MQRPEITGWGITTNENGVKIASINRDNLVEIIEYVESLEKQLVYNVLRLCDGGAFNN